MAEPMPPPVFDALMDRAGLRAIPPAEREDIRGATRLLAAYLARLRETPPAVEEEPATVFAPWEPRR